MTHFKPLLLLLAFVYFHAKVTKHSQLWNHAVTRTVLGTGAGREEDAVAVEKEKQVGLNDNH